MSHFVSVTRPQDGTALVTIARPEAKNALSVQVRDEISDALDELAEDEAIKVVVITGGGEIFSSGFDLKEFDRGFAEPDFMTELWASSDRYHYRLASFPVPTVAAVNGPAIAGGFDLAVLCDLRIASETATFHHPEYAFADVVYTPLADLIGGARARELCYTGRKVAADEALAIGLANRVVPPDAVVSTALEIAATIAVAPRQNLMRTKTKAVSRAALPQSGTLDL
jgi:enoyl-CoA hydratase